MALRTETTSINGREFSVSQLPAKRALRLFNRLCRTFAPAAARALGGAGFSFAAILTADTRGIADGLQLLFDKLSDSEQESIIAELVSCARCTDPRLGRVDVAEKLDELFGGDQLPEIFTLAAFALKLNFSSFLPALNAAISAASRDQAATPASPSN
jgi:hypothetical protein